MRHKKALPLLEYIFAFLHAYDFTTTSNDIVDNIKINYDRLINAAVLGLVFEKLNGYKEGSFYTPSFITTYMCKHSLQGVILQRFNEAKNWACKDLESLKNKLDKLTDSKEGYKQANEIFNSIKILDLSVGSGHFLVSSLNELILMKFKLGILCDENYSKLKDITLEIMHDEIVIRDPNNAILTYTYPAHENIESHKIQRALFYNKRILIESCLFGVDINLNSCEITKLRLWIELLKYSYYKDIENKRLETLPNIDINIKCGNSLISRFNLQDSLKNIININAQIKKYKQLVTNYKNANQAILKVSKQDIESQIKHLKQAFILTLKDNKTKRELERAIASHIKQFNDYLLDDKSLLDGLSSLQFNIFGTPTLNESKQEEAFKSYGKIQALRKKLDFTLSGEEYKEAFEFRFEFPEVLDDEGDFLGFDLVIGNPPYIRQENIKHLKPHLQKNFSIYKSTSDIYTYFFEQSYKVLKDNGTLSFITSNKYCRAAYGDPLREFLLKHTKINTYVDLNGVRVFESATVDTSILEFVKSKKVKSRASAKDNANSDAKALTNANAKNTSLSNLTLNYARLKDFSPKENKPLEDSLEFIKIYQDSLSKDTFIFTSPEMMALKAKIEKLGTPLKDWDIQIYRGILTGYNEAFIIDSKKREELLMACKTKEEMKRTKELIKPILRGRDIKRYAYKWAGLWVIGTFPALKLDIEDYPAVKNYLKSFMPRIAQSGGKGCRKKTSNKWFETQDNIAYYQEFAKPKIVYSEIVKEHRFYLDKGEFRFGYFYAEATSFILGGNEDFKGSLEYLLGLLHSKLLTLIFKEFYAGGGLQEEGYRYKKVFLERLPIPKVTKSKEAEFIKIVNELIKCKKDPASKDLLKM